MNMWKIKVRYRDWTSETSVVERPPGSIPGVSDVFRSQPMVNIISVKITKMEGTKPSPRNVFPLNLETGAAAA